MALISSTGNISAIKMDEQADAPATPGSADWKLYFKADGLYYIDDEGTETGPLATTAAGMVADTLWNAAGDIVYATGDNAGTILPIGTVGHVLTISAGTVPTWAAASGGLSTDTLWAAAGDLAYGTANDAAAILSIGSAHQVLTVNAGATAPAWSTGGRVLINEATPTGASVTWDSIPGTYKSLYVEWSARSDRASNTTEAVLVWLNSDTTTTNYYRQRMTSQDTTVSANEIENSDLLTVTAATAPAGSPGSGFLRIHEYAGTVFYKVVNAYQSYRTAAASQAIHHTSMEWENTAAITRVDLVTANSSNFVSGSVFRLYGET